MKKKLVVFFSLLFFSLSLIGDYIQTRSRAAMPSYHQGYARSAGQSAYPRQWEAMGGAWIAALGVTGLTLFDVSGFHHPGTLTNMDPSTDWNIGAFSNFSGYGINFVDGSTNLINIPGTGGDIHINPGTGNFTVITWVNHASTVANNAIVGNRTLGGGGGSGWFVSTSTNANTDTIELFMEGGSTNKFSKEWSGLNVGNLTMWAMVWDANDFTAYRNGIDLGAGTIITDNRPIGAVTSANVLRIGARPGTTARAFSGDIFSVQLFTRALSHSEVLFLYRVPFAAFYLRSRTAGIVAAAPAARRVIIVGQQRSPIHVLPDRLAVALVERGRTLQGLSETFGYTYGSPCVGSTVRSLMKGCTVLEDTTHALP